MGLSYHFNSPIPDSVGCILIGGLLGGVAAFMMKTNSAALVGRSIPEDKKQMITEDLEGMIIMIILISRKKIYIDIFFFFYFRWYHDQTNFGCESHWYGQWYCQVEIIKNYVTFRLIKFLCTYYATLFTMTF